MSHKFVAPLIMSMFFAACGRYSPFPEATAKLEPTKGNQAAGVVRFEQLRGKVIVSGEVTGLAANREHGFHIHEKGDCSSEDGMSAGGHFNPTLSMHGAHGSDTHHAGDLVSLNANTSGVAKFRFESTSITVGSGESTDVVNHSLIVHRDSDDFKTQPTGNSGPRLACAVIKI